MTAKKLDEISLGNYAKKAANSKVLAQMDKAFGQPKDQDRIIRNREAGLARAKTRKPKPSGISTAPSANKQELESTFKKLKSAFDPNYDFSDDHSYWKKQDAIKNKIAEIEKQLSTVSEGGTATPTNSPQKIKSIDSVKKTVTITDPSGKESEIPQSSIQPDPKDPTGKTLQTTAAPEDSLKPGTQVNVKTAEDLEISRIRKLSGL